MRAIVGAALFLADIATSHATPPARPPLTSVSHLAVYAADPARSAAFYAHDLGAAPRPDPENPAGARYYFSPTQFVEVLPLPPGHAAIGRLAHAAFDTADAEGMRLYLQANGVAVPDRVSMGKDGSRWFDMVDPEGTPIQFVQPPANLPDVPPNALSRHIIHVGFIIHDTARENHFWRDVLGFRPYWHGGMRDDASSWISLQVPDGRDWLEYMVAGKPDTVGIPPDMPAATVGVLDHFSLGVADIRQAYNLLWNGDRLKGQNELPKIGRDAKWQLNLYDPDGTRAEIMEFHAVGKPCCSPFTAADPER